MSQALSIIFILDERLTRERGQILRRLALALKSHVSVEILEGEITEERVLSLLTSSSPSGNITPSTPLVLAPWYRYLQWRKVEGFFGMNRSGGPGIVGYFGESLLPHEIAELPDSSRCILLDFNRLSQRESIQLVLSLLKDESKCGLRNLISPETPILTENWYANESLLQRSEWLDQLSQLKSTPWEKRASAIRNSALAFWSLIFEHGPGKENSLLVSGNEAPKALLQMGFDEGAFAFRLLYSLPGTNPKNWLKLFWPGQGSPEHPAQILGKTADFLRVHPITESSDIEITVSFFASSPAERAPGEIHTLWIEPLHARAFEGAPDPYLVPLHRAERKKEKTKSDDELTPSRERRLAELQGKIRALQNIIQQKDEAIRELRSGGIGTHPPIAPPDGESLIFALSERCRELQTQIHQTQEKLDYALSGQGESSEIHKIQAQVVALTEREREWIRQISAAIQQLRKQRTKAG